MPDAFTGTLTITPSFDLGPFAVAVQGTDVVCPVPPECHIGAALGDLSPAVAEQLGIDGPAVDVRYVSSQGPAARKGLRRYDVITSFQGQPVESAAAVEEAVKTMEPGTKVTIGYLRGEVAGEAELTVEARR